MNRTLWAGFILLLMCALQAVAHPYDAIHRWREPVTIRMVDERSRAPMAGVFAAVATYEVTGLSALLSGSPFKLVETRLFRTDSDGVIRIPDALIRKANSHMEFLAWTPGRLPVLLEKAISEKRRTRMYHDTRIVYPLSGWLEHSPRGRNIHLQFDCDTDALRPVFRPDTAPLIIPLRIDTGLVFSEMKNLLADLVMKEADRSGINAPELSARMARSSCGDSTAMMHAQRAVERYPTAALTHYALGDILRRVRAYEAAIPCFSRALELDPSFIEALLSRSWCHEGRKDYESAIEDLNRYMTRLIGGANDPARIFQDRNGRCLSDFLHDRRAEMYSKAERYDQAIEDYTQLIEAEESAQRRFSDYSLGSRCQKRGVVFYHMKKYAAAVRDLDRAIVENIAGLQLVQAYHYRGLAHGKLGQWRSSVNDLVRAARLYSPVHYARERAAVDSERAAIVQRHGFATIFPYTPDESPRSIENRRVIADEVLRGVEVDLQLLARTGFDSLVVSGGYSSGGSGPRSEEDPCLTYRFFTQYQLPSDGDARIHPLHFAMELHIQPYAGTVSLVKYEDYLAAPDSWALVSRDHHMTEIALAFPSGMTMVVQVYCESAALASRWRPLLRNAVEKAARAEKRRRNSSSSRG